MCRAERLPTQTSLAVLLFYAVCASPAWSGASCACGPAALQVNAAIANTIRARMRIRCLTARILSRVQKVQGFKGSWVLGFMVQGFMGLEGFGVPEPLHP